MNTDKIYCPNNSANEYAPRHLKVVARQLDASRLPASVYLHLRHYHSVGSRCRGCAFPQKVISNGSTAMFILGDCRHYRYMALITPSTKIAGSRASRNTRF